jgi:hypothetical protein
MGDYQGHPFRGNQYTSAVAAGDAEIRALDPTREHRRVVDPRTGEILLRASGDASSVEAADLTPVLGKTGLVDTHNHPTGSGPSDADFAILGWSHVAELRVLTPEGVFSITKPAGWDGTKERMQAGGWTPAKIRSRWNALVDQFTSADRRWTTNKAILRAGVVLAREMKVTLKLTQDAYAKNPARNAGRDK